MEHRHHRKAYRLRRAVTPQCARNYVVHDRAVRVHTALGKARRARRVGQNGEIVRTSGRCVGLMRGGYCVAPVRSVDRQIDRQIKPAAPDVWNAAVGQASLRHFIAVAGDQKMMQAFVGRACNHFIVGRHPQRSKVAANNRHARGRVGNVVRELSRFVHRIDRNHHCVGAQNGVITDHKLR